MFTLRYAALCNGHSESGAVRSGQRPSSLAGFYGDGRGQRRSAAGWGVAGGGTPKDR